MTILTHPPAHPLSLPHMLAGWSPAPGQLGGVIGDGIAGAVSSSLDSVMRALWTGCLWLLREALGLVDQFSMFSVDPHSGSVGPVWPLLVSVASAIALGLFFWQLTLAALRGGRGMLRAASGPLAYGVALAATAGTVAILVQAADGVTTLLLSQGLHAQNFAGAFTSTSLGSGATNGIKAVALGLVGFFGLLPAALGYIMETIWRQAAILVLVATIPITAAGLLAQSSAGWYWKACRWMIAAVVVKPALALILVIGFSVMANTTGITGILAGVGVLWVSLVAPLALYRLLAFVDSGTDAGGVFREHLRALASRLSGGHTGISVAGDHDGYAGFSGGFPTGGGPTGDPTGPGGGGPGGPGGGVRAFEAANTARFDTAASTSIDTDTAPPPPPPATSDASGSDTAASSGAAGGGSASPDQPGARAHPTPYPRSTARPSGGSGGAGAGGAAEAAEAAEAAVIV